MLSGFLDALVNGVARSLLALIVARPAMNTNCGTYVILRKKERKEKEKETYKKRRKKEKTAIDRARAWS